MLNVSHMKAEHDYVAGLIWSILKYLGLPLFCFCFDLEIFMHGLATVLTPKLLLACCRMKSRPSARLGGQTAGSLWMMIDQIS